MTLSKGQPIICPHCESEQDGPVEDYVIPGLVGFESVAEGQCHECDTPFTVARNRDGTFDVDFSDEEDES